MEKASDFDIIARDPDLFLRLNPNQIAIDEAQLLPELFASLRVAIDADRGKPGRFIITGSSSPDLINSISESLAGRVAIIEMGPFTFAETRQKLLPKLASLISNRASLPDFQALSVPRDTLQVQHDYWFLGGYPEPWLRDNHRFKTLWMQNYIRTYSTQPMQNDTLQR